MEEDVTRRTVAISVQATKLTGRVLCKAFQTFLAEMQKQRRASLTPHGRQTVKQLMGQGVSSNSIQLKGDARLFDRVARKWNVDYAFYKVAPDKHLLFFKSGQADAITACFSEYSKRLLKRTKSTKAPIREQLKEAADLLARQPSHKKERAREAAHEDR